MKLSITDVLRRGLDNTLANWPVIAIRLIEALVLAAIAIAVVIISIVPIFVSLGVTTVSDPETLAAAVIQLLATKWLILFYAFAISCVVLTVVLVVHSFVEAGCARIYIDGERAAGPAIAGARDRYRTYTFVRWWDAARDGGWTVFWIYNLIWGVVGIVLLLPLMPLGGAMFAYRDNEGALACTGCFGLLALVLICVPLAIVASVWTQKSIVVAMARDCNARDAIRVSWLEVKADMLRHVIVTLALMAISIAGSTVFGGFSGALQMGSTISKSGSLMLAFMPFRIVLWVLSTAFSSAIAGWLLASFAALSPEPVGRLPIAVGRGGEA
ncbi:MAG TPA: hypothetical protein VMU84_02710 [Thermoanaerobaculia bacterium]|nr:hypothetical protein [Thermoanaerobaculia bacterium]